MTLHNHLRSTRIRSTNPWFGKFAVILALFSMTLGLSGQANAGTYAKTKHPIVLVHGLFGFEDILFEFSNDGDLLAFAMAFYFLDLEYRLEAYKCGGRTNSCQCFLFKFFELHNLWNIFFNYTDCVTIFLNYTTVQHFLF